MSEKDSSLQQMKKENAELRKALNQMAKVQAETATDNLKLRALITKLENKVNERQQFTEEAAGC